MRNSTRRPDRRPTQASALPGTVDELATSLFRATLYPRCNAPLIIRASCSESRGSGGNSFSVVAHYGLGRVVAFRDPCYYSHEHGSREPKPTVAGVRTSFLVSLSGKLNSRRVESEIEGSALLIYPHG